MLFCFICDSFGRFSHFLVKNSTFLIQEIIVAKIALKSPFALYIKIRTRFDFLNDRHSPFSTSKNTCCVGGVVLTPFVGGMKNGLIVPNALRYVFPSVFKNSK